MKFFLDNIFLVGIAVISGGALLWPFLSTRGRGVSLLAATQLMNQGKPLVLDVRTAEEFAAGHLSGARNVPLAELDKRVGELDKFKAHAVVVICESGVRSLRAVSLLHKAGFAQAVSVDGGMAAWRAQGLPFIKA